MRYSIFLGVLFLCVLQLEGQTPFVQFPQVHYKCIVITGGPAIDTTPISKAYMGKLPTLQGIRVIMERIDGDSIHLTLTRNNKQLQQFHVYVPGYFKGDTVYVADLDHDGRLDMKIVIDGTGSGLAAFLKTKIYLFNTRDGFKLLSFFDFAYEPEYDLNHDGVFEIIGKEQTVFRRHGYWIYNLYNFRDGHVVNVSRKYRYPYWTKFLNRDFDGVPARNIAFKDRLTGFKPTPGGEN